ncbi:unnamed protein product [Schistocephalus solidus]|uniref:Plus3 domain-containing protein n=1 Tax=Schistocephalus solidus TaxID=70667 RepID=A0A183TMC3_SCHSO|nr:unnamed protein product [Schistocephalus solidus]
MLIPTASSEMSGVKSLRGSFMPASSVHWPSGHLGNTRTNKGIVLRVGKDQHTFRLVFVSNSEFLPAEFESWLRHTNEAGLRPPTLAYVAKKHDEIQKAINTIISDERVFEQASSLLEIFIQPRRRPRLTRVVLPLNQNRDP